MTRVPKKGDVYKIPLKNEDWSIVEWYETLHIIEDLWYDFVKLKLFWLLFKWVFLTKSIISVFWWLDSWMIENPYNPMGLLNNGWFRYFWKLAPRYKRLFGIYFIKDTTDD